MNAKDVSVISDATELTNFAGKTNAESETVVLKVDGGRFDELLTKSAAAKDPVLYSQIRTLLLFGEVLKAEEALESYQESREKNKKNTKTGSALTLGILSAFGGLCVALHIYSCKCNISALFTII